MGMYVMEAWRQTLSLRKEGNRPVSFANRTGIIDPETY